MAKAAQVGAALRRAEQLARERGVRLTELRRAVLELVLRAEQPIGAYELLARLEERAGHKAPPTVYRALDFLMAQKFIHRIESANAFVACLDAEHPHDSQFMICTSCGSAAEMHDDAVAEILRRRSRRRGFEVSQQIVELRGLCPSCRGAAR